MCFNISLIPIKEYYLGNNNNSFYLCNNSNFQDVINCKECTSKNICLLCQDKFTFIDGNKSLCVEKEKLKNKYILDPLDNSNFIKCEVKYMNNCDTCNDTQCLSCKEEFVLLNGNYSQCFLKSSINLSEYFSIDNFMYYYCNDDLYKERPECKTNTLNISENSEKEITLNSNDIYDMYSTEFFIESTESELNKHIDSNLYHTFEFQTEILTFYPQSTSKNTDNIPFFELYVVQVRIIDNKLKIYAFLLIKIENLVRITITIDLYTNSSIRNLQEPSQEKLEIDLYLNKNSDIQPGKIFELTSQEQFSESDRIVINKQKYSDYESIR